LYIIIVSTLYFLYFFLPPVRSATWTNNGTIVVGTIYINVYSVWLRLYICLYIMYVRYRGHTHTNNIYIYIYIIYNNSLSIVRGRPRRRHGKNDPRGMRVYGRDGLFLSLSIFLSCTRILYIHMLYYRIIIIMYTATTLRFTYILYIYIYI
jgi:hypothetical protein